MHQAPSLYPSHLLQPPWWTHIDTSASACASSNISLPFTSHVLLDEDEVGAGVAVELEDVVGADVVVLLEDVVGAAVVLDRSGHRSGPL